MIIANLAHWLFIISYPTRVRGIIVNCTRHLNLETNHGIPLSRTITNVYEGEGGGGEGNSQAA